MGSGGEQVMAAETAEGTETCCVWEREGHPSSLKDKGVTFY